MKPITCIRVLCGAPGLFTTEVLKFFFSRPDPPLILLGYLEKFEVVEAPALRERLEDIPALTAAMAKRMCESFGKSPKEIDASTNHILSQGQWPGNIRQLAAVVGKAVFISHGDKLELPGDFLDERQHLTDAIENIMSGKVFVLDPPDLIGSLVFGGW